MKSDEISVQGTKLFYRRKKHFSRHFFNW